MKNTSDRPLSPHLQVYKPQITSVSSILHRMTGVALTMGLVLICWGLIALASGREAYEFFVGFCLSPIGQIMLLGWTAAFFYHLSTGVRHFMLDSGFLFEKETAAKSGWVVILSAIVLTALTWGYLYQDFMTDLPENTDLEVMMIEATDEIIEIQEEVAE